MTTPRPADFEAAMDDSRTLREKMRAKISKLQKEIDDLEAQYADLSDAAYDEMERNQDNPRF